MDITSDDDLDDATTPCRAIRTAQSEADFQLQRRAYRARYEVGDLYKKVYEQISQPARCSLDTTRPDSESVPVTDTDQPDSANANASPVDLDSDATGRDSGKPLRLLVGAAVAELYFLKRYDELLRLVRAVSDHYARNETGLESVPEAAGTGNRGNSKRKSDKQIVKFRESLQRWESRCLSRIESAK